MTNREIDALVAEKVMGLSLEPAHYSSDISAAWQIVEKMIQRMKDDPHNFSWDGPVFKSKAKYLTNEGYPLGTECWFVVIEWDGHRKHICTDTAPMAICLAALKAVGVEVPEGAER